MRQLCLPLYGPAAVAPERHALSLLGAALRVAQLALRDEHPLLDHVPALDETYAPVVVASARLITDRCAELLALLDFYDAAVDAVTRDSDHEQRDIPF
jgi:hypothetical protein